MTGIEYPTVTIGGRTFTVQFRLASQMLMRRRGMDPRRTAFLISPRLHPDGICIDPKCKREDHHVNPDAEANLLSVFSCMVVGDFVDLSNPRVNMDDAPGADYWALAADEGDFQAIERAVWAALGKALEAKQKALQLVSLPKSAAS